MFKFGSYIMVATMFCLVLYSPSEGQGDSSSLDRKSNGKPVGGKIDEQAVADLKRAEEMFGKESQENEALAIAKGLLDTFEKNKDYDSLVDCYFLLGDGYYWLGDYVQGEKYMKQAWDLGTKYFGDQMSSYPLKVVGECQFEQKKFDSSLMTFKERVNWLKKINDTEELPGALFDVGGLLINIGEERLAIDMLKEAGQANNVRASELNNKGSGATAEDKGANAVDHAEITYHLAIAYFKLEKYDEARKYLDQAKAFFQSINEAGMFDMTDRLYSVLDDLVMVHERLGNNIKSEAYRKERDRLNQ